MEENTNVNVEQAETSTKEGAETKTYTQAEVEALLQQETDRRVSQALKKQERKNAEKIKEAENLAAMNESEKFQYQLEQREKAIAEKEKQLALAENKGAAAKILADKGISIDLVDFVVAEDAKDLLMLNIGQMVASSKENFANAREIRNYFERIVANQALRLSKLNDVSQTDLYTITVDDLE